MGLGRAYKGGRAQLSWSIVRPHDHGWPNLCPRDCTHVFE